MTSFGDSTPDMAFRSSSDAVDQLLSGAAPPELDGNAPEVACLLAALRSPMTPDGVREQEAVTSFATTVAAAPVRLEDVRSAMTGRRHITKIAVTTAAFVLLGGTAAAAASGSLPDGAQSAVSEALSHVNVHVPDPGAGAEAADDHGGSVGPDATGPAKRGLCTAWSARGKGDADRGRSGDSTAFTNLRHAAHDDGMSVEEFCAGVLADRDDHADHRPSGDDPGQSGENHGQGDGPGQSAEDHGQSGDDHGRSGEDHGPVVETPNSGGVGTGSDASGGANDEGAAHAAPEATSGSSNAGGHGSEHSEH